MTIATMVAKRSSSDWGVMSPYLGVRLGARRGIRHVCLRLGARPLRRAPGNPSRAAPNPTVVMVVMAQYMAARYLLHKVQSLAHRTTSPRAVCLGRSA